MLCRVHRWGLFSVMALSAVAISVFVAGCDSGKFSDSQQASVDVNSSEINYDNYKARKILIVVPPGNLNAQLSWESLYQNMPETTKNEFKAYAVDPVGLKAAIEVKYKKALMKIARTPGVIQEIHRAAALYQIDPLLILGTMIGEHSFNVGLADMGQDLIAAWTGKWAKRFLMNSSELEKLVDLPGTKQACDRFLPVSHADYWDCVGYVWTRDYRGKENTVFDDTSTGFRIKFFNPVGAGLTYGLGQLDPPRALMVADIVAKTSGLPMISIKDPEGLYGALLNPLSAVHYVAANITLSVKAYMEIASFDIRQNVGVVATLYNLGREKTYARTRYNDNVKALAKGQAIEVPRESYYGFFVNEKAIDLKKLLDMDEIARISFIKTGIL